MSTPSLQKLRYLMLTAGLLALGGCTSAAGLGLSSTMPLGAVAVAPTGFTAFCEREPEQCGVQARSAGEVEDALGNARRLQWAALFAASNGAPVRQIPISNVASTGSLVPNWTALFSQSESQATVAAPAELILASDMRGAVSAQPATFIDRPFELSFFKQAPLKVEIADSVDDVTAPALSADVFTQNLSARPVLDLPVTATAPSEQPSSAPRLDGALMKLLDTVNRDINARITPGEDVPVFGQADYWALPLSRGLGARGNCKHYALEKRKALAEHGVPASALSLAIVKTRWGETHAILLVATNRGEYVLDNLSTWVTPWRQTGYTWIERQAPGDPLRWMSLASLSSTPRA